MRMYDIIEKKKLKQALSREELAFFVEGVTDGSIPDYQIAAFLMAVYFCSMTPLETANLTDLMAHSGDMIDLNEIEGFKVDKHSTGGVGDKTTLIVAPIVAACGVKVAKMSGRGLGHTGGTVDKLESIQGFQTILTTKRFFQNVNKIGLSIVGQTADITPADKKLYALRDVTATVDSIPLIAASIMSKKLAAGSDGIVLDVKTGNGAFMKTIESAIELAKTMVNIGEHTGKKTIAVITDMSKPLGFAIGNALEVIEAVNTLKGEGPADLEAISLELSANMLFIAGKGSIEACRTLARQAIVSGAALAVFKAMVAEQGGVVAWIEDTSLFPQASIQHVVLATESGIVTEINAEEIGMVSVVLGAGRETKASLIDFAAGILLPIKPGDAVERGDVLAVLHTNKAEMLASAEARCLRAIQIRANQPEIQTPLIIGRVFADGVEMFEQESQ